LADQYICAPCAVPSSLASYPCYLPPRTLVPVYMRNEHPYKSRFVDFSLNIISQKPVIFNPLTKENLFCRGRQKRFF
ncbi:MAG: hypothetical protein IKR49_04800, partial [Clostridia bacterium]|nr:hypothetical protein [Clostridia bacterium]